LARRASFLDESVRQLGLGNARVCRGRAEDQAGQLAGDVVTARAVAPLDRLAGLALGLARPGGLVLAIKGAGAQQEVERARPVLGRLGARDVAVVHAGSGRVSPPPTIVRFTAGATAGSGPGRRRRRSTPPVAGQQAPGGEGS
jgi:16S rRNA (guanine527-N7)-methyltransferase